MNAARHQVMSGCDFLLKAEGIQKSYGGVLALHDGCIELGAGTVHALCGGNGAGKTTFLNIMMGLEAPDSGRIWLRGSESRRAGWFVNQTVMRRKAAELLERLNFAVDPRAKMRRLSLGQIQLVEIAKAIDQRSSVLIMDEPTSAIGEKETTVLFDAIWRLKSAGVGIIYVSHRLSELFSVADEYTVFRDGGFVRTGFMKDIDRDELIRLMVGGSLIDQQCAAIESEKATLLEVQGYSRAGEFEDINLALKSGEIVGLYGLMGAGRSEFASSLYGISPRNRGRLVLDGAEVEINS